MALSETYTGTGVAPSVINASVNNDLTQVRVFFSEEMDPDSGLANTANYSISGGVKSVTVIGVSAAADNKSVTLSVRGLEENQTYTVTASTDLTDIAGNNLA